MLPAAPALAPTPAPKKPANNAPEMMEEAPQLKMAPEKRANPFQDDPAGGDTMTRRLPATRPTKSYSTKPVSTKSVAVPQKEVTPVVHVDAAKNRSALRPEVEQMEESDGRPASFRHVPSRPVRSSTTALPVNPLR